MLRAAARRAPELSAADAASLEAILANNANLVVAGEVLDYTQSTATSVVAGGGTLLALLQYLRANLPAIIAMIEALIAVPLTPAS